MTDAVNVFRALANEKRLQILEWLRHPRKHFRPQIEGDLIEDGVCGLFLAEKLGVNASTLSEHMRVLVDADLVSAKRIKQWTFYKREEKVISKFFDTIKREI